MKTTLKNIDSLDIDFVCKAIEKSLRINYNDEELAKISNLGELCDLTVTKINVHNLSTCTNQEAFYKIRNAFCETLNISKDKINPTTEISQILQHKERIKNLKKIEKKLGFKLNLLTAPRWILSALIFTIIAGIIFLFFKTIIGIGLIILSVLGLEFCKDYGKNLKIKTFKKLIEKSVLNNYSELRRQKNTVNKNEVEKIVIGLFTNHLDFAENELTRESAF